MAIKICLFKGWAERELAIASLVEEVLSNDDRVELLIEASNKAGYIVPSICNKVDIADVTICVFAKRYNCGPIEGVDRPASLLPSPYVISESAFALARYYNWLERKSVLAFYEEGINPDELGLLSDMGIKFCPIQFDESDATNEKTKEDIKSYVDSLLEQIESSGDLTPYKQQQFQKYITVFANGNQITRNRVSIKIQDPDRFEYVEHFLITTNELESIETLKNVEPKDRFSQQFLFAKLIGLNKDDVISGGTSDAEIKELGRVGNKIHIALSFPGIKSLKNELKKNDEIIYEYAWGLPEAFRTSSSQPAPEEHDWAMFRTSYGPVDELRFLINFEQGFKFSKEPFFRTSGQITEEPSYGLIRQFKFSQNVFYQNFEARLNKFFGTLLAQWKPL